MKTFLNKLESINNNSENIDSISHNNAPNTSTDSRLSCRLSGEHTSSLENCVICGNVSNKKVTKLHILENLDKTKKFWDATRFFKDDIFTNTVFLEDIDVFLNYKLKYHATCMRSYERKYETI